MIEHKLKEVSPDSPRRCQGSTMARQCPYEAVEGTPYCPRHGGNKPAQAKEQQSLRNYRFSRYQGRVNEFADNDQVKSLREEIGVLRMTLEEIVNQCKSSTELVIFSGRIADLVVKIQKLVESCHRLELSSGEMFDKTRALNLASTIINVVSNHVPNPDILSAISNEILLLIAGNGDVE